MENNGYDGIALKAGELYDLSLMARNDAAKSSRLQVALVNEDDEVLAQKTITINRNDYMYPQIYPSNSSFPLFIKR